MRPYTHVLVAIPSQLHVLGAIPSHLHVLGAIPRKFGANVGAIFIPYSIQIELHFQFDKSVQNGMQLAPSLAPRLSYKRKKRKKAGCGLPILFKIKRKETYLFFLTCSRQGIARRQQSNKRVVDANKERRKILGKGIDAP